MLGFRVGVRVQHRIGLEGAGGVCMGCAGCTGEGTEHVQEVLGGVWGTLGHWVGGWRGCPGGLGVLGTPDPQVWGICGH